MNCESVQEMLIDSLGTLGKSSAELREHLAECPACTEVAQQQVRLGTAIHALRAASSMELQQAKGAVSRASNSERTLLAARNRTIKTLHMACLANNRRMQDLARKFEAELSFDFGSVVGEVVAPRPTPLSVMREIVADGHGFATAMLDVQSRMMRPA